MCVCSIVRHVTSLLLCYVVLCYKGVSMFRSVCTLD